MNNWITQVVTVTGMNIRSLPQRWGSTTVAVVGIAGVVMVMVGILSIAAGLADAMTDKAPKDIAIVLRAAEALERIGNAAAISPLIDALVTTHRVTNPNAPPGEFNAAFSPTGGGAGFSFGGGNKVYKEDKQNLAVWRALVELSEGQNFEYNERAWRRWFVNLQVHEHVDARRDE